MVVRLLHLSLVAPEAYEADKQLRPGKPWTDPSPTDKTTRPELRENAMGLLIVRHKVKDFAAWKKAFDGHANAQKDAGLTDPRLFRSADDHNEVVDLVRHEGCGGGEEVSGAAEHLKWTMKSAGVVDQPTMHFLEEAHGTPYEGGDGFNEKAHAVDALSARVKSSRREREGFEPPRSTLGHFGIAPFHREGIQGGVFLTDLCRRLLTVAVPPSPHVGHALELNDHNAVRRRCAVQCHGLVESRPATYLPP